MFRSEVITEDDLAVLKNSRRENAEESPEKLDKEESPDATSEK
jgi:hypothetical protein